MTTPEERYAELTGEPLKTGIHSPFNACMYRDGCKANAAQVEDMKARVALAVAEERERCAQLCETAEFTGNRFPVTQMEQLRADIAAAIRAA